MYLWYYCKILSQFGEYNVELHYTDTDSIAFSGLINDLEHFGKDFDLSDIDPTNEL